MNNKFYFAIVKFGKISFFAFSVFIFPAVLTLNGRSNILLQLCFYIMILSALSMALATIFVIIKEITDLFR